MPQLEIDSLSAGYGKAVVLDNVSIALEAGEGLAVLGRNGVGKTTLMLAIMGHVQYFGGAIRWQGRDLLPLKTYQRTPLGIGWVPQERDIFRSLTVEENLLVARREGGIGVEEAYSLFPRLRERRGNLGDKLSGGEQQMLAIARALVTNPSMLLLDEPFEGLAPIIVEELETTLHRLRAEKKFSTIIVEQHAEDALRLSDHAIVLDRGQIVLRGRSQALLDDLDAVQKLIAV